jgi:hypothetical protein
MASTSPQFVIGIPTVRRDRDYLLETFDRLLEQIPPDERARVAIVVFNADPEPALHSQCRELADRHAALIESGFLTILRNPKGYPELPDDRPASDGADRTAAYDRWKTKLLLDAVYLFNFCTDRGEYYIHLEDDVVVANGFLERLRAWLDTDLARSDEWSIVSLFSTLHYFRDSRSSPPRSVPMTDLPRAFNSATALLFRCRDLRRISDFMARHHNQDPLDWTLGRFLVETGGCAYCCVPSLVQHNGVISSLSGKVELEFAPSFPEPFAPRMKRYCSQLLTLLRFHPGSITGLIRWRLALRARARRTRDVLLGRGRES